MNGMRKWDGSGAWGRGCSVELRVQTSKDLLEAHPTDDPLDELLRHLRARIRFDVICVRAYLILDISFDSL